MMRLYSFGRLHVVCVGFHLGDSEGMLAHCFELAQRTVVNRDFRKQVQH
jgi:uncharacterized membrane protein YdbT with pleckstrin-like domain